MVHPTTSSYNKQVVVKEKPSSQYTGRVQPRASRGPKFSNTSSHTRSFPNYPIKAAMFLNLLPVENDEKNIDPG